MYKLSSLPVEILYMISGFLETKDLVTLARLNTWYSYRLSVLLSERINRNVEHEGWRIHIDILAKSYPIHSLTPSRLPYPTEILLLGEYTRINPYTLTLEFNLCPLDEEGLGPLKTATQNERSIALFNQIKTNIDIVAYFAQISPNRRLQHINHSGGSIMNDKDLWKQFLKQDNTCGTTVIGSGFKMRYNLSKPQQDQDQVIDSFKIKYNNYFKDTCNIQDGGDGKAAVISFDRLRVSPEWWIKQMNTTLYNEQNEPDVSEHCFW